MTTTPPTNPPIAGGREQAEKIARRFMIDALHTQSLEHSFERSSQLITETRLRLAHEIESFAASREREAFEKMAQHCVCTRNTFGFDYGETHAKLGKPKPGARWLTPNDLAESARRERGDGR